MPLSESRFVMREPVYDAVCRTIKMGISQSSGFMKSPHPSHLGGYTVHVVCRVELMMGDCPEIRQKLS